MLDSATAPELLLHGGRVWTGTGEAEALVIRGGRVAFAGSDRAAGQAAGPDATEVDLAGRRAVPGLIDSHIHFLRAGLTWNEVVRWDDVGSLAEGLARISRRAEEAPPGTWIRVLGGWHPGQFREGRPPMPAELDEAAPDHPVYVQLLYEEGWLNRTGVEAAGVGSEDPPGGTFERDADGRPTGGLRGPGAFGTVLGSIPPQDHPGQVASTRAFMGELNRLGVTGVVDPGGFGVSPESYRPLFDLWRREETTLRVRLYLVPAERGREAEQVREWVRYVHPGFGDDRLRYVGMGEIVSYACHDMEGVRPFRMGEEAKRELLELSRVLAARGWPIHLHAILDETIGDVLDVWERVDEEFGLRGRRFSITHAEPIGEENLRRVERLGMGIAVQDRMLFRAADSAELWGEERMRSSPPLRRILELGIPLGAGTDATVVAPHDPWRCLWWLVTGRTLDGAPPRIPEQRLTREEALRAYTAGSAWFSFDEGERGTLEPGKLADLAVLSEDYFTVPDDRIPEVRSDLTIVGGRVVHADGPFAGLEA